MVIESPSGVNTRDVLVDELLRHDTVEIERRPLDRQLDDGEAPAVRWEGDTMIVPVVKEIVVTQKRLVLVEEIRISRVSGTHRDPRSVTGAGRASRDRTAWSRNTGD